VEIGDALPLGGIRSSTFSDGCALDAIIRAETTLLVRQAVDALPAREHDVLMMSFRLDGGDKPTRAQVADKVGCLADEVDAILAVALTTVGSKLRALGFGDED
jgi:DNA-directed RNA polymerase sigma subunit (sigma70/sigma32)